MDPSERETTTDLQPDTSKQDQTRFKNHKKKSKYSYFEWAQLIATICIPLIIAIYTAIEDQNNLANAEKTRQRDLEIANTTQTTETQIAIKCLLRN